MAIPIDATHLASTTRRHFSTAESSDSVAAEEDASVDEALKKLFEDSQQQIAEASGDAWYAADQTTAEAATEAAAASWEPVWYNFADQAVLAINTIHELTGVEYAWSIVAATVVLRLGLFPVMVTTQRTASRMAHLQPELMLIKKRFDALGTPSREEQKQFADRTKSLFRKYDVKPSRALLGMVQIPLFAGMFFGLRKMPNIFPEEMATGGMLWFSDLSVPDPLYILPFATAVTFLGLIELGKDQMTAQNPEQGKLMLNLFRFMSVAMLPACFTFHAGILCYWTTNNILTMVQSAILKAPAVKKYFGIWDPPKPVPGMEADTLSGSIDKLMKQIQGKPTSEEMRIKQHNQEVETKKKAVRMIRQSRQRRGITGTQNR
jgi:YidC/Oxa1 family membrane protein insertase